jgi:small subunit ribosomal protein S1
MDIHHTPSESAWQDFLLHQCARTPLQGTVSAVVPFGCFVRLHDGVDALIHISVWPERPQVGDVVSVRIQDLDLVNRRVSLRPA